jgi:dynactin 2
MNELMEEIAELNDDKNKSKEEKESYEAVTTVVNTAKKVLDSLRLEQVLGREVVANSGDAEVKKLISQVEEYKKSGMYLIQISSIYHLDLN